MKSSEISAATFAALHCQGGKFKKRPPLSCRSAEWANSAPPPQSSHRRLLHKCAGESRWKKLTKDRREKKEEGSKVVLGRAKL